MGDGDYLTDKFPDADLDPRHNLSNDILDYNTNVTDKKFKYILDSYLVSESCLFFSSDIYKKGANNLQSWTIGSL